MKTMYLFFTCILVSFYSYAVVGPITGPTTLCSGTSITLSDTSAGGTWSTDSTTIASIDAGAGTLHGIAAGIATISYTVGSTVVTTRVTVNPIPEPITGLTGVCIGSTATLFCLVGGGVWISSDPSIAPVDSTGVYTGFTLGSVTMTYMVGYCSVSTTVTVNPYPLPLVSGPSVCTGDTLHILAPTSGGIWSSGDISLLTIDTGGIATGVATGSVNITYAMPSGCFVFTTININYTPPPIVGFPSICMGSGNVFSESVPDGEWSSSAPSIAHTPISTYLTRDSVSGINVGSAIIYYTDPFTGCFAKISVTVSPFIPAIIGTPFTCQGNTTTLMDGTTGGLWHSTNPAVASVDSVTGLVTGLLSGSATIEYNTISSCTVYEPFTVATSPCTGTPSAGSSVSSGSVVCYGTPLVLNLLGASSACEVAYQWQSSPDSTTWTDLSGGTTALFTYYPTANLSYRCKVICGGSGLFAYSNIIAVSAYTGIGDHYASISTTDCGVSDFYISSCGASSSYTVTTWFGDGTSGTMPLTSSGTYHADVLHTYLSSGTYTVKQVLYNSGVAEDSITFSYTYNYCRTLPVKFYLDANANCIFDGWETYMQQPITVEIDSNSIPIDTVSLTSGIYYKALGPVGTVYAFKAIALPGSMTTTCASVIYDTISATASSYDAKYMGLNCTSGTTFDLGVTTTVQSGRHQQMGTIEVSNRFCMPEYATLTMNFSPQYVFRSAYPAPAVLAGNQMTWYLGDLSVDDAPIFIHYTLDIPDPSILTSWLTLPDTVNSSYVVTPIIGDTNIYNNTVVLIDSVRSAYDPNEMSVSPNTPIVPCTSLNYTVSFENTGNDTAHNVYVLDTLDDNLDPHSIKIIAASATMNISINNDGAHNIVKFDFPAINLLDSSYHDQCNGIITFSAKTKNGLPDGTTIYNHAAIYFDDNPAVITDTVRSTIARPAIAGPAALCTGSSIALSSTFSTGIWNTSNHTLATINTTGNVTTTAPGTDTVSYTITNTCGAFAATKTITINPLPTPYPVTGGGTFCNTDSGVHVMLASSTRGIQYRLYQDAFAVRASVAGTGTVLDLGLQATPGTYTVRAQNPATTCANKMTDSVVITSEPALTPFVTIASTHMLHLAQGQADTLIASVSGAGTPPTYQWTVNHTYMAGATNSSYVSTFNDNDSVTCIITTGNVCGEVIAAYTVAMHVQNVGVASFQKGESIYIRPNPNKGTFTIQGVLNTAIDETVVLEVTDMLGQLVYTGVANATNGKMNYLININGIPDGIYQVSLHSAHINTVLRFVVEQ
jgi:uncharacterized repeat protein (TIGR01451 family)